MPAGRARRYIAAAKLHRRECRRLLELLLDAELVRVTALLLATVHGANVKAGVAPASDDGKHVMRSL